jgi:16S rRNA C1402 N4-methylase RsmH
MTYVTYDYYLPHTVGALLGILILVSYYFPHFIAIKCYKSRIAMNQSPKLLGLQVQPYSARRLGPPLRPQAMELRRNSRARSAMVHCFVKEQRRPPFQRRHWECLV